MLISLKVRARKAGTDAMLAFMSPPWQSYLLDDDTKIARSHTVSQIVPRLYISNLCSATNEEKLKEHGITHVVSVLEEKPKFPQSPQLKKLHIPVADTYYSPLLQHMDQTTEFIKNALEENETNVVLVHCLLGISRSATVVIGYITATTTMRPTEALDFVVRKRSITCPNPGFRRQIERYGLKLYAESLRAKQEEKKEARARRKLRTMSVGVGGASAGKLRKISSLGCIPSRRYAMEDEDGAVRAGDTGSDGQGVEAETQQEPRVSLEEQTLLEAVAPPGSSSLDDEHDEHFNACSDKGSIQDSDLSETTEIPVAPVEQEVTLTEEPSGASTTTPPPSTVHAL